MLGGHGNLGEIEGEIRDLLGKGRCVSESRWIASFLPEGSGMMMVAISFQDPQVWLLLRSWLEGSRF